ncbi:AMP-binding protein [Silvanigrella aquatica]|uniref:AMP-dependent synthetase/ligase domain-containing protein n=1 Tax=Silvanigrella aquatica TaxID=1915309 RepID=A0A1L4D0C1_9BACT|nr:AMP-binding protein [Silvanigrella aquatica]APJ03645.1 hypothetical protein AXG55_06880 [Silvanigrella aquatica]
MNDKDSVTLSAVPNQTQNQMFKGSEAFFDLLLKQSAKINYVTIRTYCHGAWHQLSGKDFCAHIGRATEYWIKLLPLEQRQHGQSIILIGRNSYNSFVAMLGAVLAGLDVMCAPSQMSKSDLKWCLNYFKGVAIASDIDELANQLDGFSVPVLNISSAAWMPQDKHPESPLLSIYREYKIQNTPVVPAKLNTEHQSKHNVREQYKVTNPTIPEDSPWRDVKPGRFAFVSFGHDGFQKPEILMLDALIITAQNFLIHAEFPKQIFWKSMELMMPSNPFAHLSRYCAMLKNGIIGFPNPNADWETNLRILRPSFLFASSLEMDQLCSFIDLVAKRSVRNPRFQLSEKIEKIQTLLASNRAMKIPEGAFDIMKRSLRKASRIISGQSFLQEAVEDLRFIVHGLAPAQESYVKCLEKLGIPVLESYGTTHAAGMLSSNLFHAAHFKVIGTPLPHVNFRLGAHSTLEYRLSTPAFENAGKWEETGDVAQMTPFGFIITGRKRHLFVTLGGTVVSPVRLEQLLKEDEIISDACVIGDKMPYLSALIVLNHNALADYRASPDRIREQVQEIINKVNESLPRNVTLKKFSILDKPFTEASGEKLTNGEINRLKIQETRANLISSLYQL